MRDIVENLGNAYLDIKREGCTLFDNMTLVLHCNEEHIALEMRLPSIGKNLTGQRREKTAVKHAEDMYQYLMSCLREWKIIMADKRRFVAVTTR